jgi:hypothetical protein
MNENRYMNARIGKSLVSTFFHKAFSSMMTGGRPKLFGEPGTLATLSMGDASDPRMSTFSVGVGVRDIVLSVWRKEGGQ